MPEFGTPVAHISESAVWLRGLAPPFGVLLWAARSAIACLGCSLGWRGTARALHTLLPAVVRPSTQLGFGVRILVSGPAASRVSLRRLLRGVGPSR